MDQQPTTKEGMRLQCLVKPETYEWIKAEKVSRRLRGDGDVIDMVVEEIKQYRIGKKK